MRVLLYLAQGSKKYYMFKQSSMFLHQALIRSVILVKEEKRTD